MHTNAHTIVSLTVMNIFNKLEALCLKFVHIFMFNQLWDSLN